MDNHKIVTDYIRFVRTYKADGDIHADRLIRDLYSLEEICELKILPDIPNIGDLEQRLNDQNLYKYLTINAKYAKCRRG